MNPEELLAELKRALESSTRAPDAPPPSASTAAKASLLGQKPPRSHWGIDPPVEASVDSAIGQPTGLQRSVRPSSPRRKLTAGGLAVGGAAVFFAGAALMNQVLNRPAHEFSVGATEGLGRPQNEQTLEASGSPHAPMEGSQQTAPLQAGALETRPDASLAPATGGSLPAQGNVGPDTSNLASSGLETAAPAFTPALLNSAPALVPTQRIGPDGAPIGTAPSTPAATGSTHPAEMPKPAVPTVAPQMAKPDASPLATAPSTPVAPGSTHPAETPKPDAAAPAAPQMAKPDGARIATAPPAPASTASAPLTETPKSNATPTAHVANESTQPSTRKIDSKKKPVEKASLQKPLRSPTPQVKPIGEAQRQSTEPARPKEAEKSPEPTQVAGNPTAVAPAASPSVPQRVADGVTHAFGYLVHLPGALVPHFGGSNPNGQ